MKVSIIISFFKRLTHLKCCLDSLQFSHQYFDEVVIADDGSPPETVNGLHQLIRGYPFPIRHIWQEKQGFRLSASRNNAIRAAQGDYLIFLDCDFSVLPDAIALHTEAARPGRFVAARFKYLPEEQTLPLISQGVSPKDLTLLYHNLPERPIDREHRNFIKYAFLRKLHLIGPRKPQCSSHFSIYKQDIEAINGYDENFTGWGGEDEDISLRMNMAGFSGYSIIKQAKALHLWHPPELGGKDWQSGSNVEYLNRKKIPPRCQNGLLNDQTPAVKKPPREYSSTDSGPH